MMTAWLVNSMLPAIGKTYLIMATPRELWEVIQETYSYVEDSSHILELKT